MGESRADDTAALKKKLADKERVGVSPESQARARVNQPVARLPVRPEVAARLQAEATAKASERASVEAAAKGPGEAPAAASSEEPTRAATPATEDATSSQARPSTVRASPAGLDDLFGMGGGESRPRPTATESTSRRPRVTENPLADGIDRRPPPPRPPKP